MALAQIDKQFGKGSIMRMGDKTTMGIESVSTGALSLDLALGIGGLPRGRVTEIYGPESSGKSTLAMHVVAEAQRNGGVCAYIDAEHAMDPIYARAIGVDVDQLLISQPDTGEQALEITDMLVRSGSIDVVVIDSVAALTPRAEIEGEMGDTHVGLQARLMSQALRKLTGNLSKTKTIAIFINQLREKIGVMFGSPETTPGGRALKFYSSVRLDIRRIESLKDGAEVVGNRTRVKVVKNNLSKRLQRHDERLQGVSARGDRDRSTASLQPLQPHGRDSAEGHRARPQLCRRSDLLAKSQGGRVQALVARDGQSLCLHRPVRLSGAALEPGDYERLEPGMGALGLEGRARVTRSEREPDPEHCPRHRLERPGRLRDGRVPSTARAGRSTASTTTCGATSSARTATRRGTAIAFSPSTTRFTHHELDIRDREGVGRLVAGCARASIVHCAAQPSHDLAARRPFDDFEVNATGDAQPARGGARSTARSRRSSSCRTNKVYGDAPNELDARRARDALGLRRSRPTATASTRPAASTRRPTACSARPRLRPISWSRSTGATSECRRSASAAAASPGRITRVPSSTGSSPTSHGACCEGRTYRIYGYKGKQVRDNLHASDVCAAALAFAEKPRPGSVYNLGGGRGQLRLDPRGHRAARSAHRRDARLSSTSTSRAAATTSVTSATSVGCERTIRAGT